MSSRLRLLFPLLYDKLLLQLLLLLREYLEYDEYERDRVRDRDRDRECCLYVRIALFGTNKYVCVCVIESGGGYGRMMRSVAFSGLAPVGRQVWFRAQLSAVAS